MHTRKYIHTHMHAFMQSRKRCMSWNASTLYLLTSHTHTHTHTHIHIHTHTHTHTHAHTGKRCISWNASTLYHLTSMCTNGDADLLEVKHWIFKNRQDVMLLVDVGIVEGSWNW